ncbi:MAG: hypothetical protein P3X24_002035 [bacterium]|nr:hypothetical protein [bacterium]
MSSTTHNPVELGELVRKAEEIVEDCFGQGGHGAGGSTGRTQLSNAIDAINQSRGSIEVFLNWLRYQMAREEFWRRRGRSTGKMLGELIAKYAEELQKRDPDHADQHLTHFLGFMRRALIALNYLDQIPAQVKEASTR